jgi:hypothetical protein
MKTYTVTMRSGEAQTAVVSVEADDEMNAIDKAIAVQDEIAPGGAWEIVSCCEETA